MSTVRAVVDSLRVRQWVKNLLVFAAPGAAGMLDNRGPLADSILAFAAFCAAASATYVVNDLADREADRHHPTKRHRPIAAGRLSAAAAVCTAAVLAVLAAALSLIVDWRLMVVVASYVALTTAYSVWLKHLVVLDVVAVAAGFVLRAIGGAVAVDVPISDWFFIVTCFGSLFVVTGKRTGELATVGGEASSTRAALDGYPDGYLGYLRTLSSAVVLVAYCLWAFETADTSSASVPWFELSILPFTLAVLRYALLIDRGEGGAPEELFLRDVPLLAAAMAWAGVYAAGIYLS